jgi:hypothetical protein
MNQEILEALRKSLPSIQVDLLKAELAKAEKLATVEHQLAKAHEENKIIITQKDLLQSEVARLKAICKAEEELNKLKNEFEVERLKYQLAAEKEKTLAIKELAYAAFRNPTVIKNTSIPVAGSAHSAGWTQPITETTEAT